MCRNKLSINMYCLRSIKFCIYMLYSVLNEPATKCMVNTHTLYHLLGIWVFLTYLWYCLFCRRIETRYNYEYLNPWLTPQMTNKRPICPLHHPQFSLISFTARTYLQYRRHSPNQEILLIGRQFCLRIRRLSFQREDNFSSEKETVMRITVCICAPYNCRF